MLLFGGAKTCSRNVRRRDGGDPDIQRRSRSDRAQPGGRPRAERRLLSTITGIIATRISPTASIASLMRCAPTALSASSGSFFALHDGIDFPTAFLGAIEAGIVPVAVNTQLSADEFAFMLADSRARAIIVSAPILPVMQKALGLLSGPKPSVIVSDPANKGSGLANLLAEAAALRRCRLDPPRRTMLLALFVRLDRPSKRNDPRPQEPGRDSGILRHPGSRDRRDRYRLFRRKTVFRLWARQRADLSAGGRRHKRARRRTPEPAGWSPASCASSDRLFFTVCQPFTMHCSRVLTCHPPKRSRCGDAFRPASHCRQILAGAGPHGSALTSSTASARPKCCTFS